MNRRQFLRKSAIGFGSMSIAPALTQLMSASCLAQDASSEYKAIVCVFLGGGADTNNFIVPMDGAYNDYANSRSNILLAKSALNPLKATSDKRPYGLHPMLSKTAGLFNAGELAVLANVGTLIRPTKKDDASYAAEVPASLGSHVGSIGAWSTAMAGSVVGTGWAGRVADALISRNGSSKMPSVVSTAGYTILGQGAQTNLLTAAASDQNTTALLSALQELQQYLTAAEQGDHYNNIQGFLADQQVNVVASQKILTDTFGAGTVMTTFPGTSLGQQLMLTAKLIAGRSAHSTKRQIFCITDPNYDTHTGQAGMFAVKLPGLDDAIAAFVTAMKEIGMYNSVTLFTASDFGRTLVQNAENGTDHGWGGHHFIVGGAVKGGDLYGMFPDLVPGGSADSGKLGAWIPTTSTTQYAATMANWLGVPGASLATVFPELPNFDKATLPFLG